MATLYISEFDTLPTGNNGQAIQIAYQPATNNQTVAISGSSAQSTAFKANTRYVRLHTDAICSFLFGTNPTATTSSPRLPADGIEYYNVQQGQSHKVAVITNT